MSFTNHWEIPTDIQLSPRHQELVTLIAEGYHLKEIAARMGMTHGTVKMYRYAVYRRLGIYPHPLHDQRAVLTAWAVRRELIRRNT